MRPPDQKVKCEKCGRLISEFYIKRHLNHKKCIPIDPNKIVIKRDESWKIGDNQYKCPDCGSIHCGSGICMHVRMCRGLTKSSLGIWAKGKVSWKKGLTKETDESIRRGAETLQNNIKIGKTHPSFLGRKLTEDHKKKISVSRKKYLNEHSDQIPYLLNHSSKESYPEKYFIEIFEKENIPLKYHLQIGIYQLDFYNEIKGICLEIDGEQHFLKEKDIERDIKRTVYLESLGWKIIRIRWSEYQKKSTEEKHEVIQSLKKLLKDSKEIENFQELMKSKYKKNKELHEEKMNLEKLQNMQNIALWKNLILKSNVDFQKFGWLEKIRILLNTSHTRVSRYMKEYMCDFYSQCYHKNLS